MIDKRFCPYGAPSGTARTGEGAHNGSAPILSFPIPSRFCETALRQSRPSYRTGIFST